MDISSNEHLPNGHFDKRPFRRTDNLPNGQFAENIYVIYRIGGPYREIFLEVLKKARGRRPRDVFKTERNISLYGPTIPVNNIFIFFNPPLINSYSPTE
jgi:hypothetical protein